MGDMCTGTLVSDGVLRDLWAQLIRLNLRRVQFENVNNLLPMLYYQVFFPAFLQSEIYFKYLTELLNSVAERRRSTADTVGSVDDVRSLGTAVNERSRLVTSFGSELDLTENPDAIWHRPNAG